MKPRSARPIRATATSAILASERENQYGSCRIDALYLISWAGDSLFARREPHGFRRSRLLCVLINGHFSLIDPALNQVFANRPDGRLSTVSHTDLAENVLNVFLHSLVANMKRLTDLLIR